MENLRTKCFRFYYWAQALVAPGLKNAQFEYAELLKSKLTPETRWLDIGCGRRLFPEWMPRAEEEQVALRARLRFAFGIDPDLASLRDNRFVHHRVASDSRYLPFADASFDLLTANMVVEHVASPGALLSESFRVLKPRGIFLFHTPNALSYATILARVVPESLKVKLIGFFENRKEEDVFPTLYLMNTPTRVGSLSRSVGLRIIDLRMVESSAQAIMLGPLVVLELFWIRLLRRSSLRSLRSNLIVVLQKPAEES
jgi:ubiquinone/menaquinone biosynthesis C-methylase UbiE